MVEHVYFNGVPTVDDDTRRSYLERAYCLGKEFAQLDIVEKAHVS